MIGQPSPWRIRRPLLEGRTMRSLTPPPGMPATPAPGRTIPVPDVAIEAPLSWAAFFPRRAADIPSVLDAGPAVRLTAGRFAIALTLEALGLAPDDEILVPAFHCSSMIEPLAWCRVRAVYYRIGTDLAPELTDVAAKLTARSKAMIVPHYFGFPQPIADIRAFCDDHGLALIEDCAHAFFGAIDGKPLGSTGDYTIASPRKFFPVHDGGCLISPRGRPLPTGLKSYPPGAAVKAVFNMVEKGIAYGRLPVLRPAVSLARATLRVARSISRRGPADTAAGPESDGYGGADSGAPGDFNARWTHVRMSPPSRFVLRFASRSRIVSRRRENYLRLRDGLSDLPGCRPLLPELGPEVVPYLFALWVDDLEHRFSELEDLALPMQRFGQFLDPAVDDTVCPTSVAFSRHLVEFSCNQEITADELQSMIERIRSVMKA